jgi:molybdopterin/thiamine biosynthesis adenylyltransferase
MTATFSRASGFSRTIGWITPEELDRLGSRRIAIAGLGGVGGSHLLTLTRLGVGRFSLAEMDTFSVSNLNRQAGAFFSTLGRPKLDVLSEMALDINPTLSIRRFPTGLEPDNLDSFLQGADLYVDGLDFFELEMRRAVFAECARRNIPAVTAAPLGMGTAILAFAPGGMTFEQYFHLDGQPEEEQYLRFLIGLSPAMLQMSYLVAPEVVQLAGRRGPSTPMACELCAGIAATVALKLLLGRGTVVAAPWGLHFDPYRNRLKRTYRPYGNRNPLQKLALMLGRKQFRRTMSGNANARAEDSLRS